MCGDTRNNWVLEARHAARAWPKAPFASGSKRSERAAETAELPASGARELELVAENEELKGALGEVRMQMRLWKNGAE